MIRSYQEVGRGVSDTVIHTLGKRQDGTPLRSPRPIPLMMPVWFLATLGAVVFLTNLVGVSLIPKHVKGSMALGPATILCVALPAFVAWAMTLAEVEGRRVHVLLRVWIKQGRAKHYVGGWLPVERAPRPLRYRDIKVRAHARYCREPLRHIERARHDS